jgi:MFS family permease
MSAFVGLDAAWRPRASPMLIAVVASLAPFMEILDSTIINVSLPHIAGSLSASYDDATWTLTSYLVANGIVMPLAGWLSRLLGRKRYFLISITMFTFCSFLCGSATSLPQLVVFRLLQGLFGGGLQPCQQAIVLDAFEPSQRSRGFAVVAFAVIFAPILGPILGGWITDSYSWRWMFLINVPIGLFALLAVTELVEDPPWVRRDRARLSDIDAVGLGLIALGLGSLQIMLDRGEDAGWFGSPTIRVYALLAAMGLAGAVAWLLLTDKPIVNLRAQRVALFVQPADPIAGAAMAGLHRAARRAAAIARRAGHDRADSGGQQIHAAECADAESGRVRLPDNGRRVVVRPRPDTRHRLHHAGAVPRGADRGHGLPVRAEQHAVLHDLAARAEPRRDGAVCDVPQHLRLDRHHAGDGDGQ